MFVDFPGSIIKVFLLKMDNVGFEVILLRIIVGYDLHRWRYHHLIHKSYLVVNHLCKVSIALSSLDELGPVAYHYRHQLGPKLLYINLVKSKQDL